VSAGDERAQPAANAPGAAPARLDAQADTSGSAGASGSGAGRDTPRQRLLRLGFLALLAGGLVLWTQARKPRALGLELDLAAALPGQLSEVDLIVRRGDRLLWRKQLAFGKEGAPQLLREQLEATPGEAELEAELVYRGRQATRTRAAIALDPGVAARVVAASASP